MDARRINARRVQKIVVINSYGYCSRCRRMILPTGSDEYRRWPSTGLRARLWCRCSESSVWCRSCPCYLTITSSYTDFRWTFTILTLTLTLTHESWILDPSTHSGLDVAATLTVHGKRYRHNRHRCYWQTCQHWEISNRVIPRAKSWLPGQEPKVEAVGWGSSGEGSEPTSNN